MTKEQLQAVIDEVFAFTESKLSGHPFVVEALEVARKAVDVAGIDALLALLASKGLV